jgi:hypothetical protein
MLNKEELRELRIDFWNEFEEFTRKKRTANNRKINWASYKSGIKDIYFRLDFDTKEAFLAIDLQMRDSGVRELVWDQFLETEKLLKTHVGDELEFYPNFALDEGFEIHRLKWALANVNITNKKDYPRVVDFLFEKIHGLDRFWFEFSDLFNALCR